MAASEHADHRRSTPGVADAGEATTLDAQPPPPISRQQSTGGRDQEVLALGSTRHSELPHLLNSECFRPGPAAGAAVSAVSDLMVAAVLFQAPRQHDHFGPPPHRIEFSVATQVANYSRQRNAKQQILRALALA